MASTDDPHSGLMASPAGSSHEYDMVDDFPQERRLTRRDSFASVSSSFSASSRRGITTGTLIGQSFPYAVTSILQSNVGGLPSPSGAYGRLFNVEPATLNDSNCVRMHNAFDNRVILELPVGVTDVSTVTVEVCDQGTGTWRQSSGNFVPASHFPGRLPEPSDPDDTTPDAANERNWMFVARDLAPATVYQFRLTQNGEPDAQTLLVSTLKPENATFRHRSLAEGFQQGVASVQGTVDALTLKIAQLEAEKSEALTLGAASEVSSVQSSCCERCSRSGLSADPQTLEDLKDVLEAERFTPRPITFPPHLKSSCANCYAMRQQLAQYREAAAGQSKRLQQLVTAVHSLKRQLALQRESTEVVQLQSDLSVKLVENQDLRCQIEAMQAQIIELNRQNRELSNGQASIPAPDGAHTGSGDRTLIEPTAAEIRTSGRIQKLQSDINTLRDLFREFALIPSMDAAESVFYKLTSYGWSDEATFAFISSHPCKPELAAALANRHAPPTIQTITQERDAMKQRYAEYVLKPFFAAKLTITNGASLDEVVEGYYELMRMGFADDLIRDAILAYPGNTELTSDRGNYCMAAKKARAASASVKQAPA